MKLRAALLVALLVAGDGVRQRRRRLGRPRPTAAMVAAATLPAAAIAASTRPPTVERIIPVNGDLAEVVYALGFGDQVVATDISATYPPEAEATPKIGYQRALVAETILSFEPTVVLADDLAGPPEVLDQLRSAGVRVVDLPHQSTLESAARRSAPSPTPSACPSAGRCSSRRSTPTRRRPPPGRRGGRRVGTPEVLALYLRGENVQLVFGAGSGIDAVIDAAGGTDLGTEMGVVDNAELSTEASSPPPRHPPRDDHRPRVRRRHRRAPRHPRHRPDARRRRTAGSSRSRTSTCTASARARASSSPSSSTPFTPPP